MANDYLPLAFEADGARRSANEETAIINALMQTTAPITDMWVLAHGWNNDVSSSSQLYTDSVAQFRAAMQRQAGGRTYNPLFVGIHWPSKAWVDDGAQAGAFESLTRNAVDDPAQAELAVSPATDRERFIATYRPVMDPEGAHGPDFDRDFGLIYDMLHQTQPATTEQAANFVAMLQTYRVADPHGDALESNNVLNAPVELLAQRLSYADAPRGLESFGLPSGLIDFFRSFTFWQMKARAGVVGEAGVYPFLLRVRQTLRQNNQQVRIHMLGHSFGAKLCAAALYPATVPGGPELPFVTTLMLLQGAFSQFSFSDNIPDTGGVAGRYAPIMTRGVVANPVAAIHSEYDTANRVFYPAGMTLAAPFIDTGFGQGNSGAFEDYQPSTNRFGSIGYGGMQGLAEQRHRAMDMHDLNQPYTWDNLADIAGISIDGSGYINHGGFPSGAHSDILEPQIYHLALALSQR